MTAKLLAGGVAALTIIGAAAAGITPAAGASADQSGIWVQRVTRGPYAQETTPNPPGGCVSSCLDWGDDDELQQRQPYSDNDEPYSDNIELAPIPGGENPDGQQS